MASTATKKMKASSDAGIATGAAMLVDAAFWSYVEWESEVPLQTQAFSGLLGGVGRLMIRARCSVARRDDSREWSGWEVDTRPLVTPFGRKHDQSDYLLPYAADWLLHARR